MDESRLFLKTLEDLESRADRGQDEYDVLGISALLRKLLLDEEPLMDRINRTHRLKIRFIANVREPSWTLAGTPPPIFWSMEDGFDPDTAHVAVPAELKRDELLQRVVMLVQGHEITVKDAIRQAAHL